MASTALATPAPGSLTVANLEVGYGHGFGMSGINLQVAPGDVVGVIGPNGGGKSTLLKAIARVLPYGGTVSLGGRAIEQFAGRIAFVPQREEVNWDFPVSALDVVLMGRARAIGWGRRASSADRERATAALARLGLDGMGARHISQFSGGQQQRIFLARALAQQPAVLLLDEPFTGVDAQNRELFRDVIRECAAAGCIVLMATHDLEEAARDCDALCCINRGLIAYGPVAETYTPETMRATFGGQVAVFS